MAGFNKCDCVSAELYFVCSLEHLNAKKKGKASCLLVVPVVWTGWYKIYSTVMPRWLCSKKQGRIKTRRFVSSRPNWTTKVWRKSISKSLYWRRTHSLWALLMLFDGKLREREHGRDRLNERTSGCRSPVVFSHLLFYAHVYCKCKCTCSFIHVAHNDWIKIHPSKISSFTFI